MRKLYALVVFALSGAALIVACGEDSVDSNFGDGTTNDASTSSSGDPPIIGTNGEGGADAAGQAFTITPVNQVVTFTSGKPAPTVQFVAKTATGVQVPASFSI